MTRTCLLPSVSTAATLALSLLLASFVIVSCTPTTNTSDYHRICEVIEVGMRDTRLGISIQEKADLVVRNVYEALPNGDALDAFTVLSMAPPETRYGLFKEEAERALGESWECAAWEQLQAELVQSLDP